MFLSLTLCGNLHATFADLMKLSFSQFLAGITERCFTVLLVPLKLARVRAPIFANTSRALPDPPWSTFASRRKTSHKIESRRREDSNLDLVASKATVLTVTLRRLVGGTLVLVSFEFDEF